MEAWGRLSEAVVTAAAGEASDASKLSGVVQVGEAWGRLGGGLGEAWVRLGGGLGVAWGWLGGGLGEAVGGCGDGGGGGGTHHHQAVVGILVFVISY